VPCDEYRGKCDVTSGYMCVRFDDVTERQDGGGAGAGEVQCVCALGVNRCTPTDTRDHAHRSDSDVIDDDDDDDDDVIDDVINDDDDEEEEEDVVGHSRWLLTHRHTDSLIGKCV